MGALHNGFVLECSSAVPDRAIAAGAERIAARAVQELEALVAVSSPSGDLAAGERAVELCIDLLPAGSLIERPPCSTSGCAADLLARIPGRGRRKLLLLGHLDTVFSHPAHVPARHDGARLIGSGTADMKGGVVLALGVARELALQLDAYAELAVLLVTDEEWRTAPFAHVARFDDYDACLCFEAGERNAEGEEAVVVRRKAAGTIRVTGSGRAAHSGSAPDRGRSALLALARVALTAAALHDPRGSERLSVVPTVLRAGEALNVVPASGELMLDLRADRLEAFEPVLRSVPLEIGGAELHAQVLRRWPGMDSRQATAALLTQAAERLGRPIVGVSRGGASDASHFAATLPLTVDGLGPRGGGAHTPEEFILDASLRERAEVALALATSVLLGGP